MKQKLLVDTNIIVRLLTGDPKGIMQQAEQLIQKVEKEEIVFFVPSMVVAETYWVLKSLYSLSKQDIAQSLKDFLQSEGVELEEPWIIDALEDLIVHNVDFIDAYLAKKSRTELLSVLTWNKKHFKKLSCEFYTPENLLNGIKDQ